MFSIVIVVLLSLSYNILSRKTILDQELQNLENLSNEIALHLNSHLEKQALVGITLSSAPLIQQALLDSNAKFAAQTDQQRKQNIDELNQKWKQTTDIDDPFIQAYLTNRLAKFLKKQQVIIPRHYGEIFITNRYGAMIASTGKLTTLAHAHKYWWQAAFDDGRGRIFLDDRGFDTSVGGYVLGIVIPIKQDEEIIGILKCNVNIIGPLTNIIDEFNLYHSGKLQIVRSAGLIVAEYGVSPLSNRINESFIELLQKKQNGADIINDNDKTQLAAYFTVNITEGSDQIGFGGQQETIDNIKGNQGEAWHVVVSLNEDQALMANQETSLLILYMGIAFTLLSAMVALLLGKCFTRPILKLAETARTLGEGRLETRAKISSKDELGGLAESLNTMATNFQSTMISRDELRIEIEQRKKAEAMLTQFKDTLDRTLDSIFIFDPETLHFSYANRGAVLQVGYDHSELLKMTPLEIKPEFNERRFRAMAEEIIKSRAKKMTFETLHQHKNGETIPVEEILQYIELDNSARFVAVVRDISRQKEVAQSLQRLNAELENRVKERTADLEKAKEAAEQASIAKGLFIANMSHEFRTPLNAVLGFSQLMLNDEKISSDQRKYLNTINKSGQQQLSLINDVLAMSSLDNGQTQFKAFAFEFSKLLEEISETATQSAKHKGISFKIEYRCDIPRYLYTDYQKLLVILRNIIDNAVKFTESGGVTLSIGRARAERETGFTLLFEIEDSGIGIEYEMQQRIFTPFFQIAELNEQIGTGLGLTLSQRYLKLMGGEIKVESQLGKGTKFYIELPVMQVENEDVESVISGKQPVLSIEQDGQEYRILLSGYEDDRLLLRKILEPVGFVVREASDREQLIDIFKHWQPQMIWVDTHMHQIMDTLKHIRGLKGGENTIFAAVSAFPFNGFRNNQLPEELDEFITKPVNQNELFACMAKHLGLHYRFKQETVFEKTDKRSMIDEAEMACLDDIVLCRLNEAIQALDMERTLEVAEDIKQTAPELSQTLIKLVQALDFNALQQIFESYKR